MKSFSPFRVLAVAFWVARILPHYLVLMLRARLPFFRPNDVAWDRAHRRAAHGLHWIGVNLGGLFVKLCQIVGARGDVFPAPFIERLRQFHDRVPPRPFATLRPHVEAELGRPLEEVFEHVDETPLAAASLAQVHRARLGDGADVVLKIQYPEIARLTPVDIASVHRVVRLVSLLDRRLDLRSLVGEVAALVGLELDFEREARSTERVAANLRDLSEVVVPRVHGELSTARLLVLEYLEGIPVTNLEALAGAGIDPREVARKVGRAYAHMIFEDGFFHGDPHPGNLLVRHDGAVVLLDFGLAKELPKGFAEGVKAMVVASLFGDAGGARRAAADLGFTLRGADDDDVLALIGMLFGGPTETSGNLFDQLGETPIEEMPADFGLIARTLVLLTGLSHTLAPKERVIQTQMASSLMMVRAAA